MTNLSGWMTALILTSMLTAAPMVAQTTCADLPAHAELTAALKASVAPTGGPSNGGLDFHAWAVIVDRDGKVCAVTMSGNSRGDQFPISRLAAAQKANAANGSSLDGVAFSSANSYPGVQPGGVLFAIHSANPPDARVAYGAGLGAGAVGTQKYGTFLDPLVGTIPGGWITSGGGIALYNGQGKVVGGLGVGGDTACADHNIAWRIRKALRLDNVPFGFHPDNFDDGMIYDIGADGVSGSGFGHPFCGFREHEVAAEIGAGGIPNANP